MKNKFFIIYNIFKKNFFSHKKIFFIVESVDWVIKEIAKDFIRIFKKNNLEIDYTYSTFGLKNKILHFGSVGTLLGHRGFKKFNVSNRSVLSWYHVLNEDERLKFVDEINKFVDFIHVPCDITKKKLLDAGIYKDKIILIPEGIDLKLFRQFSLSEKQLLKNKIGLPTDKIIIGSFQKDGCGWGEGNEPKMEKGPDIFCDVAEKLAKQFPIHILLTGPARGYVKNRLKKAGISFTHHFLNDYSKIVDYYNALDLYLITSRVEGGPKAVLESMACGVPLVSTRVGMANDLIKNGENGFLADVENVNDLSEFAKLVLNDKIVKEEIKNNGLETVKKFEISLIVEEYWNKIYSKLI